MEKTASIRGDLFRLGWTLSQGYQQLVSYDSELVTTLLSAVIAVPAMLTILPTAPGSKVAS